MNFPKYLLIISFVSVVISSAHLRPDINKPINRVTLFFFVIAVNIHDTRYLTEVTVEFLTFIIYITVNIDL